MLHCCCGPCSSASIERLQAEKQTPILFYSNSNIFPKAEYDKRLHNLQKVANHFGLELHTDTYDHEAWRESVRGLEEAPEGGDRCRRCFQFNLARSAEAAKKLGLSHFTTTLTVSPYKNSKTLFQVGGTFPGFEEWNFKKKDGYKRSIELSRQLELYRQDWCGCEFSKRDRDTEQ